MSIVQEPIERGSIGVDTVDTSLRAFDSWIPEFDPSEPIAFSPELLWYLLIAGFVAIVLLGFFALFVLLLS